MRVLWWKPPNVKEMHQKRDIKGLLRALSYKKDRWLRIKAADALGDIGDTRSIKSLIGTLQNDTEEGVRSSAISALGHFKDQRVLDAIVLALQNDTNSRVRSSAISALADFKDQRALDAIGLAIEKDTQKKVRICAAKILAGYQDQRAIGPLIDAGKWELIPQIGEPAVEPLIECLRLSYSSRLTGAAKTLGLIGSKRSIKAVKVLSDRFQDAGPVFRRTGGDINAELRESIVQSLGLIGDPSAKECLVSALDDRETSVRRNAALSLQKMEIMPDAIPGKVAYFVALNESQSCADAGPSAIPILISLLDYNHRPNFPCICNSLISLSAVEAIDSLLSVLIDAGFEEKEPYEAIINALVILGKDRVDSLIAAVENANVNHLSAGESNKATSAMKGAAKVLARLREPRGIPPLLRCLEHDDVCVNSPAQYALEEYGLDIILEDLIATLQNPPGFRSIIHIAQILRKSNDINLTPYLIEAFKYRKNMESNKSYFDINVLTALKQLTGEDFGVDIAKWEDWWQAKRS